MANNIFPTPQQMADMLLACCDLEGARTAAEEDIECAPGTFWISLDIITDTMCFRDGFWYDYSEPVEGYRWAPKRFAEVVAEAWHYVRCA